MKIFGAWVIHVTSATTALALRSNTGALSALKKVYPIRQNLVKTLYSRLAADAEQVDKLGKVCDQALAESGTTSLLELTSVEDMAPSWYPQDPTLPPPAVVAGESGVDVRYKVLYRLPERSYLPVTGGIPAMRSDELERKGSKVSSQGAGNSAVTSAVGAAPRHLK
jgi:hypothetical protein